MTDSGGVRLIQGRSSAQLSLLEFLARQPEFQFNTWAIETDRAWEFDRARDLASLKRRGLVDGEGRGNGRQWWITATGKEAVAVLWEHIERARVRGNEEREWQARLATSA